MYWLMKSEPDVFSIDHLKQMKVEHWDGIRNYQARNFMRDQMKPGDLALFYHSNANPPGVAGVMEVVREAYPDFTSWDENSPYFDPKSSPENPRWMMVDVQFKAKFKRFVSLDELRGVSELKEMLVLKKGSRLSIQPVTKKEFEVVCALGGYIAF